MKPKKICIATWYTSTNYGTCLQAYALKTYLQIMGFDSYMLERVSGFYKTPCLLNWLYIKILRRIESLKKRELSQENEEKLLRIDKFTKEEFKTVSFVDSYSWKTINNEYFCFISGGDQIWNPYYLSRKYLLDFIYKNKSIKKISYATSIGVSNIPFIYRRTYCKLWKDYDYISVREESAADLICNIAGVKSTVVLDSTFLLNLNEWHTFADKADRLYEKQDPYILCYFVGKRKEYWSFVNRINKLTGCDIVDIPMHEYSHEYYKIESAGPREFVDLIRKARMVITDSFHATVFSIKFHKDFCVLKRFDDHSVNSQNDRIYNVLKVCGLQDRLFSYDEEHVDLTPVDFCDVELKLKTITKRSIDFLRDSLESK